jgi:hypothetical protein
MTSAKFCTRVLKDGTPHCGAAAHVRKFQPPPSSAFLKDMEVRALCSPAFDLSTFSPSQRLRIQGVQLTAAEWDQLFLQVQQRKPPKWLAFEESPVATISTSAASTVLEILSPTNVESGGLLSVVPMLSFDESTASGEDMASEMDLAEVTTFIYKFRSQFASLKTKWARAFTEVEAGYGLVVEDLQKLQKICQGQSAIVGSPLTLDGETPPTLWDGLHAVHETVTGVASAVQVQAQSIDALSANQTHLTHSVLALESQADESTGLADVVSRLTMDLRALENRVLRLVPLLNQLRRNQPSTGIPALDVDSHLVLAAKVENCEQLLQSFRQTLTDLQDRPNDHIQGTSSFDSRLREVQVQMKQLQLKVVGKGVQIANKTFQTFEDVKVWVDANLPNHRYSLFVDGVSIFEFFTAGHIEAEATYSAFYSQHKTGFKSTFEARVVASVQNLFPSVFGRSDSNVDTAEALPALPNPSKWDSNDGNTGLRYQIMRNMADVELQIQETINTVLGDYLEAQHIARECLHHSKRFALELCQFITLDFQKWKHRGHSPKDAWKMTAVCVRRIFEELYSERVVARDVYDQGNPSFTTSKYLWATWKAHTVMSKYLRHQFYEHPSISAVLARHLADNYVKPDDSHGAKIKALENRVQQLETHNKNLQSKYDTMRVARDNENKEGTKGKNWKGPPAAGSG